MSNPIDTTQAPTFAFDDGGDLTPRRFLHHTRTRACWSGAGFLLAVLVGVVIVAALIGALAQ